MRARAVDEVDTAAILSVLKPIWQTKPETASGFAGALKRFLDAARANGDIAEDRSNPARWRGHLDKLLAKRAKLSRGHHAAMDYAKVPAFFADLRERDGAAALALGILHSDGGALWRSAGARWPEIDLAASLDGSGNADEGRARTSRSPFARALALLEPLSKARTSDFLFAGQRAGKPLSVMAMEMVLRRMGVSDVTVHGFRSAFGDWAGNETHFARELAQAALSHVIGDKAEQAYRRSDALERRRELMTAWGFIVNRKSAPMSFR